MEAGRSCDAYGLFEGHSIEQADAKRAYTQAYLTNPDGVSTYVLLPEDQWPDHWKGKYKKPTCKLVNALYGHPESGGHWEQHCERHVMAQGFEPIPEWQSCYYHPELKLFLVVYVDDFKMSGPAGKLVLGWESYVLTQTIQKPLAWTTQLQSGDT